MSLSMSVVGVMLATAARAAPGDHVRVGEAELVADVDLGLEYRSNVYRQEATTFPAANFRPGSRHGREALSEPEARALGELVASWRPELVLVAHSFRGTEFVNYDGPARKVADRFALESGFEVRGSEELEATPGSFGVWAGVELGIPVLTIEYRRGRPPGEAWQKTREAILAVITQ